MYTENNFGLFHVFGIHIRKLVYMYASIMVTLYRNFYM